MKKTIEVVCAIIQHDKKFLCVQRSSSMSLPLMWEFPGGKVDDGEDYQEALVREIHEELSCEISVVKYVASSLYSYDFANIHLHAYLCKVNNGEVVISEHADFCWLEKDDLNMLDWAAADIPIIETIINTI